MMMLMLIRRIEGLDHENNDIIINNSPTRLIRGGRAKFARPARIHQMAMRGKIV